HLPQAVARAAAVDGEHLQLQTRIGLEEAVCNLLGTDEKWRGRGAEAPGNADLLIEPPRKVVIAGRVEPGAAAMLPVLVNDEPRARHDVQHPVDDPLWNERPLFRRAVFGIAALVLRPEAMQHERVRARGAPALRVVVV